MKRRTSLAFLLLIPIVAADCMPNSGRDNSSPIVPKAQTRPAPDPIPGSLHVVTLGDSLAYGAGDEAGKGIPARLKPALRERGVEQVETVNLGMNGAQTSDVLFRLKQERVRNIVAKADAIVLSVGANDLFRTPNARDEVLKNPLAVAERILNRLVEIVAELHAINPGARVLILGGYNPVPGHQYGRKIDQYLEMWDAAVAAQFEDDPRVAVVRLSDVVTPNRLSRYDHFHPGGEAYEEASRRIAMMLTGA